MMTERHKNSILTAALILLCALFLIGVLKNIGYPLLWNDEAETAMFAERILRYGYPKIHDGKNEIFTATIPIESCTDPKSDAYIGTVWGHFYFSVIGALPARNTDDIYAKTAFLRIPFALIGILGLAVIALMVLPLWSGNRTSQLLFLVLFALFEIISISLILHLRQVRYYPMVIFLSASILCTYVYYKLYRKISTLLYAVITTAFLILIFNTFTGAYVALVLALGLHECALYLKERKVKRFLKSVSPLVASIILLTPLIVYFRMFEISSEYSKDITVNLALLSRHFLAIYYFLSRQEFLTLALVAKAILVFLLCSKIGRRLSTGGDNEEAGRIGNHFWVSNFITLFFVVYVFVVIRAPVETFFQRYYIVLQPLLAVIILADLFMIATLIKGIHVDKYKKWATTGSLLLLCPLFLLGGMGKAESLKSYAYELTHQYRGPLDVAIPFLRSTFKNTDRLVIATNYEEASYIYYLGSKVIMGFAGNTWEEDLRLTPNVVLFRKSWRLNWPIFSRYLTREPYTKISFSIFDNAINTIPEIEVWLPFDNWPLPHLYRTRYAESPNERLEMYIRTNDLGAATVPRPEFERIKAKFGGVYGEALMLNAEGIKEARSGNNVVAIELFGKALETDPYYAEPLNNLGFLYTREGLHDKAEESFEKALAIDPGHKKAKINLDYLNGLKKSR